jgi:hypothetical protein
MIGLLSDMPPKRRFARGSSVDKKPDNRIGRRDLLLGVASVGVATTALAARAAPSEAPSPSQQDRGKRKAQYQGNSPEIQTFYRNDSSAKLARRLLGTEPSRIRSSD